MKAPDYQALSKAKRLDWACGEILIGIGAGEFRAAVERVLLTAEATRTRARGRKARLSPRQGKAASSGLTPLQEEILRRLSADDPQPVALGRGAGPAARFLIRDGLVVRDEQGYSLTDAGRAWLAQP